jgi:hypothetical protein
MQISYSNSSKGFHSLACLPLFWGFSQLQSYGETHPKSPFLSLGTPHLCQRPSGFEQVNGLAAGRRENLTKPASEERELLYCS